MNITPERAIELASKMDKFMREEVLTATMSDVADVIGILRHYAEILPKWQAMLDVSTIDREDEFGTVGREEIL